MVNTESDGSFAPSSRSSHSRRSRQPRGVSYTDRFRTDTPFAQPAQQALAGLDDPNHRQDISIPQILAVVDRATAATLPEPDLYLNLQIADLVKEKGGNSAREVAMRLAKIVSSNFLDSTARRAVYALSVLDVCVKNCGYPFHLAISRRDFLNQLVKRLPERPPMNYSRVQTLILEMIEEWNATLVKSSRHRDDFGFIRDMHRLLSYKGYIFPEVSPEEIAALTPEQDTLKSAAELEREDREAQSAKLQELIRSGSPQDLKEANRLMSIMAGFRETRVDYHAKVAAELDKVRRKADILAEMLQHVADKGSLPEGGADDVFSELSQSLKASLPKIKHILADEEAMEEDEEAKDKILALQATVEAVLAKHAAVVSGDANAANISIPAAGSAAGASAGLESLIDIGDDNPPSGSGSNSGNAGEDLLSLSLGSISLGDPARPPSSTADILQLGSASPQQFGSTSGTSTPSEADPFTSYSSSEDASAVPHAGTASHAEKPLFSDNTLTIAYTVKKIPGATDLELVFSNPSGKKITNVETQFAPPRSFQIEIGPLSQTHLEPRQSAGIRQRVTLKGTATPKLRWKANYNWGLETKSIGGDLKSI